MNAPGWEWDPQVGQSELTSELPVWGWRWEPDQAVALTEAPRQRQRQRWPAVVVVPLCAVAPWFVPWPWQGVDSAPTKDPSSIIHRAVARSSAGEALTGRERRLPNEGDVAAVTREVSASAGGYDVPVTTAGLRTTPGPYQRVGRIQIPRAGLDVSYGEGVYAKTLERGPGHWPGTPLPGEPGNSVLSGHRNTHTQPFKELDRLKPGDRIVVSVGSDNPVAFRVDNTTIVPEAQFKDFVLRQPSDPATRQVTLFACHPEGNPIFRIVVRASVRR